MKWFLLALQLFPTLLKSIVVIEQVSSGLSGADKKKLLIDSLPVMDALTTDVVSTLTDKIVSNANNTGLFTTTPNKK